MGGKANKTRRKQQQLRQKRANQPSNTQSMFERDGVCPLYQNPPKNELYKEWIDCVNVNMAEQWTAAIESPGSDYSQVLDRASRMSYFASVYGRMVPVVAAHQLDLYIDDGYLPVQWGEDDPITAVSLTELTNEMSGEVVADARAAVHQLHALGFLMIFDDGTVIPLIPAGVSSGD